MRGCTNSGSNINLLRDPANWDLLIVGTTYYSYIPTITNIGYLHDSISLYLWIQYNFNHHESYIQK